MLLLLILLIHPAYVDHVSGNSTLQHDCTACTQQHVYHYVKIVVKKLQSMIFQNFVFDIVGLDSQLAKHVNFMALF